MKDMLNNHTANSRPSRPVERRGGGAGDCVIGIDTGGTYTDAVLLDYQSRRVLDSAKTLTTRENLAAGISEALAGLKLGDPAKVRLVGISSTLATNSIAEDKARAAGLILIGYDPELVEKFSLQKNFSTPCFAYFKGGHDSQGKEKQPLDLEGIKAWVREKQDQLDALAISSYFSPLNPSHEERALEEVKKISELPVVLGCQLSTQLDSIKRATTACLNASLVAVMREFIEAVKSSLDGLNIKAPLMIVKGDGSLMPRTEAAVKPVETILSGPSASAIGGRFLTGSEDALMIDVGGTTTDMAMISNSCIEVSEKGARVGDIETAVRAAHIRTACIGCDSRISVNSNGETSIGPDRVMPLSRLAANFPETAEQILKLKKKRRAGLKATDLEYYILQKKVPEEFLAKGDSKQAKVLKLLAEGPRSLTSILEETDCYHAVQLNLKTIIQRGMIEFASLTPTDLLHVTGDMELWDKDVAEEAVRVMCVAGGLDPESFPETILERIVKTMVEEAMVFMARAGGEDDLPENIEGKWARWFFNRAFDHKRRPLAVKISSAVPIIGIGAPAEYFVSRVAKALNARFILPDHSPVANAVGAVAGSVMVDKEALVYVRETAGKRSYQVQVDGRDSNFKEFDEALAFAEQTLSELVFGLAVDAGASNPEVSMTRKTDGSVKRIRARAVGNPDLEGESALLGSGQS